MSVSPDSSITTLANDPSSWRDFLTHKLVAVEANLNRLHHAHAILSHALSCPYDDITRCPKFAGAVARRLGPRPSDPDRKVSRGQRGGRHADVR